MPRHGRTEGQHLFSMIPSANIQRSVFNRSCGLKTTFDVGDLVPIFVDEALPGDTMEMHVSSFGRVMTMLVPVMENMFLDFFFFAVPNRLLWSNWQKFNGEQTNPGDSTNFLVPYVTVPGGGFPQGSLSDYFGIPTQVNFVALTGPCALWYRAYNLIYKEWFRDENLTNSPTINVGDGPDAATDYPIRKRAKRHDYFTSCLPWPEKNNSGTPVRLPLGTTAPVERVNAVGNAWDAYIASTNAKSGANAISSTGAGVVQSTAGINFDPRGTLVANLSTATAATINDIRQAFQIQRMYERDARGGSRYTEILRSHFGVVSPDARLQRPEYLGGGSARINANPVASTSQAGGATVTSRLGELSAFGTVSFQGIGFRKSFVEHCVILGLVNFRADLNYQQGLERMWSRRSRFEFYWPSLAHLGEQSVLNKEIFLDGSANDNAVFGYQERYAEYRYKPSRVTGLMRSNATGTLHYFHLAQLFGALPVLNDSFITDAPPVSRIVAAGALTGGTERNPVLNWAQPFLLDCWFSYRCTRPMPVYGVPGLIDHF